MTTLLESTFLLQLGKAVLTNIWQTGILWILWLLVTPLLKPSQRVAVATFMVWLSFLLFVSAIFIPLSGYNAYINEVYFTFVPYLESSFVLLAFIYALLLGYSLFRFGKGVVYTRNIQIYGLHKAPLKYRLFTQKHAEYLSIRKKVTLWLSDKVAAPLTVGVLKPVILFPVSLMNQLSIQQVEAIILHELTHIKRNDFYWNFSLKLIQSILYFNPFVKMLNERIDEHREKICDQMVLQFDYNAHNYAAALLNVTKHQRSFLELQLQGQTNTLLRRIEVIMGIPSMPSKVVTAKVAGLISLLGLTTVLVFFKPEAAPESTLLATAHPTPLTIQVEKKSGQKDFAALPETLEQRSESIVFNENSEWFDETEREAEVHELAENTLYYYASNKDKDVNSLSKEDSAAIDQVFILTKKAFTENEWSKIEQDLADAFTNQEKAQLKKMFIKKANMADWVPLRNQLIGTYGSTIWDSLNLRLLNIDMELTADSLLAQYTINKEALLSLQYHVVNADDALSDEMVSLLLMIDERLKFTDEVIAQLKGIKAKKIIRL